MLRDTERIFIVLDLEFLDFVKLVLILNCLFNVGEWIDFFSCLSEFELCWVFVVEIVE